MVCVMCLWFFHYNKTNSDTGFTSIHMSIMRRNEVFIIWGRGIKMYAMVWVMQLISLMNYLSILHNSIQMLQTENTRVCFCTFASWYDDFFHKNHTYIGEFYANWQFHIEEAFTISIVKEPFSVLHFMMMCTFLKIVLWVRMKMSQILI